MDFFNEHNAAHKAATRTSKHSSRIGTVVKRKLDPALGPMVRLNYQDKDNINSAWLQVMQHGTQGMQYVRLPRIGETMVAIHLDNGQERGVAIGGIYSGANVYPGSDALSDEVFLKMDDGATFLYDPGAGKLAISGVTLIDIQTLSDVKLTCGGALAATVTGNATLKSPSIKLDGPVEVTGLLTLDQGMVASGGGTAVCTLNGVLQVNGSASCTSRFSNADGSGGGS